MADLDQHFLRRALLAFGQRRLHSLDSLVVEAADLDDGLDLPLLVGELRLDALEELCLHVVANVAFVEHRRVTKVRK